MKMKVFKKCVMKYPCLVTFGLPIPMSHDKTCAPRWKYKYEQLAKAAKLKP